MREFDEQLLRILKIEAPMEQKLRYDAESRNEYMTQIEQHSGDSSVFLPLKNLVTVSRKPRYVPLPPHRTYLVELHYLVSGFAHVYMEKQKLTLKKGDILLPNQNTIYSMDALGDDDILLTFILKPQFFEDIFEQLRDNNQLTDFIEDMLRRKVSPNRYLHFINNDNLPIHNLIETMAFASFPELTDENILCGENPAPEISNFLMRTLFVALSRNLSSVSEDSPMNYAEVLRHSVCRYIGEQYKTASLKELALVLNQSDSTLSRQIKRIFGLSFKELLLQKRFARAAFLLEQTNLPISDIAEAVGYENTGFFYRRFRQIYGNTPKNIREP